MKRIIDRKIYNTETATLIHRWDNGCYGGDFRACEETLYKTPKGTFFIAGNGGPRSRYAVSHGNSTTGGEGLHIMTPTDAIDWLESHEGTEAIEKFFAAEIEEA